MPIDPSIAMGVRPLEVPNQLAQYGQLMQIQAAQRQNEVGQMQMDELRRDREGMQKFQAEVVAKGGNPDLNEYATMLLQSSNAAHQKMGIELKQKLMQQAQFEKIMGAGAPAAPVAPAQAGALGSGTYGALPANALAPSAAPTNALAAPPNVALLRQKRDAFLAMGTPQAIAAARALDTDIALASKEPVYHNVPGVGLVDPRTGKTVTAAVEAKPTQERLYNLAVSQGYKGSFDEWNIKNIREGSTKINMPPVAKSLAGPVGSMAEASLAQAKGSVETMNNANAVREALNTGNVIAGPMAGVRTKFAQVMDLAGAGDKEKLAATRSAIQGLAAITLESRSALKGQGQITDFETGLLEKARSGNIADMTIGELHTVVDVSQRLAQRQSGNHETLMGKMRKDPNASDVVQYYEVGSPLPAPVLTGKPKGEVDKRKAGLANIFGEK